MELEPQRVREQGRSALEDCFARIRLARATELAQAGRLLEAEALLAANGELPDGAPELDLLARIAAHQGRFNDARRLWSAAIQKEPQNEIYKRCIEQLTPAKRIARLIVKSQETLLQAMVWVTIAIGIGALAFTFWFE